MPQHFETFGGENFDFHGVCDLVLTETASFDDGLGLAVHVRTKGRANYSYIEAAAVKVNLLACSCVPTALCCS